MEEPKGWWDEIHRYLELDEDTQEYLPVDENREPIVTGRWIVTGRCANCGEDIFEGEGDSTVHYGRCWNEFKSYLDEVNRRNFNFYD